MHYLPIFVGVTAGAVLIQIGILVALFVTVHKSTSRMDVLASEVKTKVMPIAETAKVMLAELKPKITTIAANVGETTTMVRGQIERVDAAVGELAVRADLQAIRVEKLLNHTKDHIDETSDLIHRVFLPVRRLSGLVEGAIVGLEFLMRAKHRSDLTHQAPQGLVPLRPNFATTLDATATAYYTVLFLEKYRLFVAQIRLERWARNRDRLYGWISDVGNMMP
jgi:hypothetical protein